MSSTPAAGKRERGGLERTETFQDADQRERLQRLTDHREISDLLIDYCTLVDECRYEEIGQLFTEDCVFDYGEAFGGRQNGRRRLVRGAEHALSAWDATSHHLSNIRIRFDETDPDLARAESYLFAWHRPPGDGPSYHIFARYRDRIVRRAEGWRIAERILFAAGQHGADYPLRLIDRAPLEPRGQ